MELPEEVLDGRILYFNSGLAAQDGSLWMTTYGGGVWSYDGGILTNQELSNEKEEILLICIYQDQEGLIWLGTNNDGVYRQSGDGFKKFEPKLRQ